MTIVVVLVYAALAAGIFVLRDNKKAGYALTAAVIVWTAVWPLFFGEADGLVDDSVTAMAYVIMALGLNIVVGFAGLLDLGYVAFFAFGAYATGWLASGFIEKANIYVFVDEVTRALPGIHLNFVLVVIAAMVICAIAGMLIGLPTLRLRGDYIAIVTLAFGEIIRVFAINGDEIEIAGQRLTAGRQGITPVDLAQLPFTDKFTQLNLRPWFWTALGLLLITLFVNVRLRDSRLGRAWIALREDEVAAASMGVPLVKTKLLAYATGAAFGGMAGTFLSSYLNTVNADQFQFAFSILILAMIILGGLGSIWGVVVGAIALSFINTRLIPDVLDPLSQDIDLGFRFSQLGFGIFGFLLVVMMVVRPEGLIPEKRRQIELTDGTEGRADEPPIEVRA